MSADPSTERRDGPTPAGGSYSVIVYLREGRRVVPRSEATGAVIREFDADGVRLAETWGSVTPNEEVDG